MKFNPAVLACSDDGHTQLANQVSTPIHFLDVSGYVSIYIIYIYRFLHSPRQS